MKVVKRIKTVVKVDTDVGNYKLGVYIIYSRLNVKPVVGVYAFYGFLLYRVYSEMVLRSIHKHLIWSHTIPRADFVRFYHMA